MLFTTIDELEKRIEHLRTELIQTAKYTGINSQDTICCSQKLDQLITVYQKHCIINRKAKKEKGINLQL